MRRPIQEFTLPKYPELLEEINNFSMSVKIHHLSKNEDQDKINEAKKHFMQPTWHNVSELLDRIYKIIDQDRVHPIKY